MKQVQTRAPVSLKFSPFLTNSLYEKSFPYYNKINEKQTLIAAFCLCNKIYKMLHGRFLLYFQGFSALWISEFCARTPHGAPFFVEIQRLWGDVTFYKKCYMENSCAL
jgi:hypothetical protein